MVRGEISKFVVKLWSVRRIRESVLCEGGLISLSGGRVSHLEYMVIHGGR